MDSLVNHSRLDLDLIFMHRGGANNVKIRSREDLVVKPDMGNRIPNGFIIRSKCIWVYQKTKTLYPDKYGTKSS